MKIFEQNATKVIHPKRLAPILKDILGIHEGDTEKQQINVVKRILDGLGIQGVKPPLTLGDFTMIGESLSEGCSVNPQVQSVIIGYYMNSVSVRMYKK